MAATSLSLQQVVFLVLLVTFILRLVHLEVDRGDPAPVPEITLRAKAALTADKSMQKLANQIKAASVAVAGSERILKTGADVKSDILSTAAAVIADTDLAFNAGTTRQENALQAHESPDSLGCGVLGPQQETVRVDEVHDLTACEASCRSTAYRYFGLLLGIHCWCAANVDGVKIMKGKGPGMCNVAAPRRSQVYRIRGNLPEVINLYIAPAKRTSSMFTSGRLDKYFSGKYAYRKRNLNAQIFKSDAHFRREVCERTPGKKIFVQIAGSVTYLLQHWPDNSVLIMTADEIGNWGLGKDDRRFGPHGRRGPFKSNESSPYKHILLPNEVFPMFKQYHHYRQAAAFGDRVRFIPLGSRNEYPDIAPGAVKAAPNRKYVFSYMAALTDSTRRKVYEILNADASIPNASRFIHVSQNWHGTANNEEYVSPSRYQQIMLDSMFAICPKGHSVEQFRIYEALEAGSIPVMDLKSGYLAQHLPQAYLDSPMLLLNGWDSVVAEMTKLWKDPAALLARQQAVLQWYDKYMREKLLEIESVLEERAIQPQHFCTTTS